MELNASLPTCEEPYIALLPTFGAIVFSSAFEMGDQYSSILPRSILPAVLSYLGSYEVCIF